MWDQRVKERLLREPEITLAKAIEIGRAAKIADAHMKNLREQFQNTNDSSSVCGVNHKGKNSDDKSDTQLGMTERSWEREPKSRNNGDAEMGALQQRWKQSGGFNSRTIIIRCCEWCGFNHHPKQRCPAAGKNCLRCGKLNHFSRCCRSQQKQVNSTGARAENIE